VGDDPRTDAALLAATARRDDAAFAVLVRRHIRAATLLAAQLLGDQDEAEDTVQDAFQVVHRQAPGFDAERPFGPWFYAIVRRLAANRRSRDSRRARLMRFWSDSRARAISPPPDVALLARFETMAAIRAMDDLSPMQRACFELVAIRDLSTEEVAAMHGISESTVRQHVFRARTALRAVLDEQGPDARTRNSS
jgi:RNA polymerase sigma-70 factor, ECF subfamily